MTFDELWAEIGKLHILPETAIEQVPKVLSEWNEETAVQENSRKK